MSTSIQIVYDGLDASNHYMDAKLFGQSLQGIDKLVSDALIIFTHERLPKRGERAPLILKANEPKAGSFAIGGNLQEVAAVLALGMPLLSNIGTDVISHYVTAAIDFFRGRDRNMEIIIGQLAKMHQEQVAANDRSDERRHVEVMGMQELLRQSIASNSSAAIQYVAPIGSSAKTASFVSGANNAIMIDESAADEIRDFEKLDWGTVTSFELKTDGFKFHTNGLSVENPENDGFLMAEVNDPAFEEESNAYTVAAQKRARIEVLARRGYKKSKLAKIQIVDFVREIDNLS